MIEDMKRVMNHLSKADKLLNEVSENHNLISFERFEKITKIVSDLLKCTCQIDDIRTDMEEIPDNVYVNLVVLHNSAVDFVTSYEKFKKDTEVK